VQQEYRGLVEDYFQLLQKRFGERLRLSARSAQSPWRWGESDIDILVVVEGLPDDVSERAEETVELLLELKQKPSHHRLTGSGCFSLLFSQSSYTVRGRKTSAYNARHRRRRRHHLRQGTSSATC
ncbi:MAG: hypothetical protein RMH74_08565, partial [Candidatus Caldarchaeum sp.]|nr:hypothetical protein [Candidatus Caldarchaeum sp.]